MSLLKCQLWKHLNISVFIEQEKHVSPEHTPVNEFPPRTELQTVGGNGEHISGSSIVITF